MLKRSALLALIATGCISANHVHGSGHKHHYAPQTKAAVDVKQVIPNQKNEDICSFYIDDSLYILKPIISNQGNYNKTLANFTIEFNICNTLNNAPDSCQGSFACITNHTTNVSVS